MNIELYLIRHGATPGNLERRFLGTTDEELSQEGIKGLMELKSSDQLPSPDMIFSSPMRRCLQTANILFPGEEVKVLRGMEECDFGIFEYRNHEELSGDPRYREYIDSGGRLPFPGGESREDFEDRILSSFEGMKDIIRKQTGEARVQGCTALKVALVCHGGCIMTILSRVPEKRIDFYDGITENGGIRKIELII